MCDRGLRDAIRAAGRPLRGLDRLPVVRRRFARVANLSARVFLRAVSTADRRAQPTFPQGRSLAASRGKSIGKTWGIRTRAPQYRGPPYLSFCHTPQNGRNQSRHNPLVHYGNFATCHEDSIK
jgi:hypothetical protein